MFIYIGTCNNKSEKRGHEFRRKKGLEGRNGREICNYSIISKKKKEYINLLAFRTLGLQIYVYIHTRLVSS